jgi:hypothetical protein
MTRVYVFTGPTLSPADACSELAAIYRPPAAQGDVYRAALDNPWAIALIDGYFESVPAVWHKEILWALTRGIRVYGSASMGALRAAELHRFGMIGVGAVFEWFRDGILEDDDEVAVTHGPEDTAFRRLSEAMVNIRATLRAAESVGVLNAANRLVLERLAKDLYYPERSYDAIWIAARTVGIPEADLTTLRRWLPEGRVDQKRADAFAMLRRIRADRDGQGPGPVDFEFEHTVFWETVARSVYVARPKGAVGTSIAVNPRNWVRTNPTQRRRHGRGPVSQRDKAR